METDSTVIVVNEVDVTSVVLITVLGSISVAVHTGGVGCGDGN